MTIDHVKPKMTCSLCLTTVTWLFPVYKLCYFSHYSKKNELVSITHITSGAYVFTPVQDNVNLMSRFLWTLVDGWVVGEERTRSISAWIQEFDIERLLISQEITNVS